MEEIYANVDYDKSAEPRPSINHTSPRRSEKRVYGAVVCLGLLCVFLLAGLIGLGVHYHVSLRGSAAALPEMTQELDRPQSLRPQNKTCPVGWRMLNSSCYLLSLATGSWDEGRQDCIDRVSHLVVIDNPEEQMFLFSFIKQDAWIGLNDKDEEGTWKWIDGNLLTLMNWDKKQPDNGGGDPKWGEEDCAHIRPETAKWNDRSCETVLHWICERRA